MDSTGFEPVRAATTSGLQPDGLSSSPKNPNFYAKNNISNIKVIANAPTNANEFLNIVYIFKSPKLNYFSTVFR